MFALPVGAGEAVVLKISVDTNEDFVALMVATNS
jgi:hypothetical protein